MLSKLIFIAYSIKYIFTIFYTKKRNPVLVQLEKDGIEINSGIKILVHQQNVPEHKLHPFKTYRLPGEEGFLKKD